MLLLLALLAFRFSVVSTAELLPREMVDFTIEAGELIGTGNVEFKSLTPKTEVVTGTTATAKDTRQTTTDICQATIIPNQDDPSTLPSLENITPRPPPNISTSYQSPSNGTKKPVSSPTLVPVISRAMSLRHGVSAFLFSLGTMGLCMFIL